MISVVVAAVIGVAVGFTPAALGAAPEWTTYHHDAARSGIDPEETAPLAPTLAWQTPALDGKMYAEPLVYGSLVYAATENDTIYALNAATGEVAWSRRVGVAVPTASSGLELKPECNQVGTEVGITSTPVIDPATNTIYAVTLTWNGSDKSSIRHELVALDLTTGAMRSGFPRPVDPAYPPQGAAAAQLQRPALAFDAHRIIIGYGSYGDCGVYWGWLVSAPESGAGPLLSYQVDANHEQGSIWAAGNAPLVEPSGDIYVATANGLSGATYEFGDSVLRFDPNLELLEAWAPVNWQELDAHDLDLGSSSPIALPHGLLFQSGKTGEGILLRADALGNGPGSAPLAHLQICEKNGNENSDGGAIFVPTGAETGVLYVSCLNGDHAVSVSKLGSAEPQMTLVTGWPTSEPENIVGPPILAGGLVWVASFEGTVPGTLYGIDPGSGEVRFSKALGTFAHFATPSAAGGRLFVANGTEVTAFTIAMPPAPSPTATTLTPSADPVTAGGPVTLTATVSPAPDSGSVTFSEAGIPIPGCAAVNVNVASGGAATCQTAYPAPGTREILASYSGDPYYDPSTSSMLSEVVQAPASTPAPLPPAISRVRQSHPRWREGSTLARVARRTRPRLPVGTTFGFALNEPATVRLDFARARRTGRAASCRPPRAQRGSSAQGTSSCARPSTFATLLFLARRGANRVYFDARLAGGKELAAGRYTLTITASNAAGVSAPRRLHFTILGA